MNVRISGRHMEVTDALKSYVQGGLDKLRSHFDRVIDADVVLAVEKHRHIAEISLHANGIRIHSKEASPDMYASVDAVLGKLDKQVRRFRDRINRHQPRTSDVVRDYHHQIIESMPEDETPEILVRHRVIHHESLSMRPMSVDEAVMQLELSDDAFLLFMNADTQLVNAIYSRADGTYGLIEPQF